jgi:glycine/D-amino acid oxidase-like deaminating enzyme
MKVEAIIIGAGLFGSMTSKFLRSKNTDVLLIDSDEVFAASKCSFGVWKEGWINKSISDKVNISLPILDKMIGITTIDYFNQDKNIEDKMFKIDCSKILDERNKEYFLNAKVDSVSNNVVTLQDGTKITATKAVVIAAGVYTDILLEKSGYKPIDIDSYWGATLDFKMNIDISRYKTWSPYKQSVLLKLDENKFIFGDGSTVKNPKPNDKRVKMAGDRLVQHAIDLIGLSSAMEHITSVKEGMRPYLPKGNHDFVVKRDRNLYTATGGAKNSTILSGYVAQELYNFIKQS